MNEQSTQAATDPGEISDNEQIEMRMQVTSQHM